MEDAPNEEARKKNVANTASTKFLSYKFFLKQEARFLYRFAN